MNFSIQPFLENDRVQLVPLKEEHFETLYAVASDPAVWAEHPNKNRYERAVFENFFKGALESGGGYIIIDKAENRAIGSTRFYDYDAKENSILIGYTFYGVEYWGKGYNNMVKKMMLEYIFQYVDRVLFHVGSENYRSQAAMRKLGATVVREIEVAYYGEPTRRNVEFEITRSNYRSENNRVNIKDFADNLYEKEGIWISKDDQREISYPKDGNTHYFEIEDDSFWFQHRNKVILSAIQHYAPDSLFFDIGGGNGYIAKYLEEHQIPTVLVEPGMEGALNARKRGLTNVVCSTFEDAGMKPNVCQAVGLFDVVEHIEDDLAFMKSIHSIMAVGGKVFITVPAHKILWSREDDDVGHYRRYKMKQIKKLLEKSGFKITYSTFFFSILPIPIFLFRSIPTFLGLNKKSDDMKRHKREHSPKLGFISRILDWIWRRELKTIQSQKRIRFGGSCLVVATKI